MKVFKNIIKFLGLTDESKKVELTEEQIGKIDTSLGELETITTERDGLKTKVTELETAVTADKTKITGLESQVTALTSDKTKLEGEKTTLQAEVTRLGKLDGGKITTAGSEGDRHSDDNTTELSASQKELNEKIKNI